jgi:hypothetical protein
MFISSVGREYITEIEAKLKDVHILMNLDQISKTLK